MATLRLKSIRICTLALAAALALAAPALAAVCGDGIVDFDFGEQCDDGYTDACGSCNATCTGAGSGSTCGDGGVCPETEFCDPGLSDPFCSCNANCTGSGGNICGDGTVCPQTEACDDGTANGTPSSCCSAACGLFAAGTACEDGNGCTIGDQCNGVGVCSAGGAIPPPGEVPNVGFEADAITLSWDPIPAAPAGTVYDVARGVTSDLPVGGSPTETCVGAALLVPGISDPTLPAGGEVFWYLARGRHVSCAGTYGYGLQSGVPTERVTAVCP
jgi:hypothetical protein